MSGDKKEFEPVETTALRFVRDSEFVAVCTVVGAAVGAGIAKFVQITSQLEYSEYPGAAIEIPIKYPVIGFALLGASLAIKDSLRSES